MVKNAVHVRFTQKQVLAVDCEGCKCNQVWHGRTPLQGLKRWRQEELVEAIIQLKCLVTNHLEPSILHPHKEMCTNTTVIPKTILQGTLEGEQHHSRQRIYMLDRQCQRVNIPACARTAQKGVLQKRLEEVLC